MGSNIDRARHAVWMAGATAASALLVFFGTGLHPLWWPTWFAPLPILVMAPHMSRRETFFSALTAWCLGGLNMWPYTHYIPAPVIVVACLILPSAVFGLCMLAYRTLLGRDRVWFALLGVPALAVAYEYLLSIAWPHGTFGSIAYSQLDFLLLLQLASITGIWGISFCIYLFSTALALVMSGAVRTATKRQMGGVVSTFFLVVLAYGEWRLAAAHEATQPTTVILLATDTPPFPSNDPDTTALLEDYARAVRTITAPLPGAHSELFVVLPEKIGLLSDGAGRVDAILGDAARQAQATVIVGVERLIGVERGATRRLNEARVYGSDGLLRADYVKHHLLPGAESLDQPGTQLAVWSGAPGRVGVQICKDLDFPALSRQYSVAGAALLLVPAWDFWVDGWLHARMAMMRGVEGGFTLARVAKQGLLTVSDSHGRVLAEQSSGLGRFSSLTVQVPLEHVDTVYGRWGDWFAYLNALTAVAVIVAITRAVRHKHPSV